LAIKFVLLPKSITVIFLSKKGFGDFCIGRKKNAISTFVALSILEKFKIHLNNILKKNNENPPKNNLTCAADGCFDTGVWVALCGDFV
jgi:hypothetical protein